VIGLGLPNPRKKERKSRNLNKGRGTGPGLPPSLEWVSSPPLAAVLIAPKGAESSDSGRMRVIGALVHCFPSETVWDKLHSPSPAP